MFNFCSLVLLASACTVSGYSQYGSGKIGGRVLGRDGKPLANATIYIDRQDIARRLELKTDKNGEYFYPGMDRGIYRISVVENGVPVAVAENLNLSFDDRITQDFDLRKQNQRATAAASTAAIDKAQKDAESRANAETQGAFNAGLTALNAGKTDEAIQQFTLAAERRPAMPVIWARLGSVYVAVERFNEATDAYMKASDLKPDDAGYLYNLGIAACKANRMDVCQTAIAKSAGIDPTIGSGAYYNIGQVLVSRGSVKEGEEAYQKALVYNPNNADANYEIALLHMRDTATISTAVPYLEKYLKISPNGPKAATAKQLVEAAKASSR